MVKLPLWIPFALALGLACAAEAPAPPPFDEATWRSELLADRAAKDEEYNTSATSPMAGVHYLKSEPGERFHLSWDGETFRLGPGEGPDDVFTLEREAEGWRWQGSLEPEPGLGPVIADPALFAFDRFHLRFYGTQDQVTFVVFDPERNEMKAFEHLLYFPPDPTYAVQAELHEIEPPEEVVMLTSRNLEKTFYRFATLHFEIDGSSQQLAAYKYEIDGDDSKVLFVPFRDGTSGQESYGAGRFLIFDEPEQATFTLDFNLAFNPLCNYSPAYNCAIPPRENHLKVPIRAGELSYPH